jgi:amidophosphoribosyltransferase
MGAREVHVRIAYPPWRYICTYGINTKKKEELALVAHGGLQGICNYVEADSLQFLPDEALHAVLVEYADPESFCTACTSGQYRI